MVGNSTARVQLVHSEGMDPMDGIWVLAEADIAIADRHTAHTMHCIPTLVVLTTARERRPCSQLVLLAKPYGRLWARPWALSMRESKMDLLLLRHSVVCLLDLRGGQLLVVVLESAPGHTDV